MIEALHELANPVVILAMVAGVTAGMLAGALPGLTATMSVALLVPYTFAWKNSLAGLMILIFVLRKF